MSTRVMGWSQQPLKAWWARVPGRGNGSGYGGNIFSFSESRREAVWLESSEKGGSNISFLLVGPRNKS